MHIPVLLNEVINYLNPSNGQYFLDCTIGCGGHSSVILERIGKKGFLWGIDSDKEAIDIAKNKLSKIGNNFEIINDNFKNLKKIVVEYNIHNLDGILLDLGVSSLQLDTPSRGFSFKHNGPLDMRFDKFNQKITAKDIVNTYSLEQLENIIFNYGEERYAKKIAKAIVSYREKKLIETTKELHCIIEQVVPFYKGLKNKSTKTFQALRIEVNQELEALETVLPIALSILKSGGKLAVISFHSLEDRIVKNFFNRESVDCICNHKQIICSCNHKKTLKILTKKPIIPNEQEIISNVRARSAKLRVVEKL